MMCLAKASDTINILLFMTLEELTTLDKLNEAFYECSRISKWKESTQRYKSNLLLNNIQLQEDVRSGNYKVSPTTNFTLNERGKIRQINAPAIRDRVIQKVLCKEILIPQLSKSLIYDNYASLKGRGTSFARKRFEILFSRFLRKHGTDGYILQVDIKKYFDSIDHEVLKTMVHERINEPKEVMDLIDYVIDTSSKTDKGLNLGAEAPQIFAIYYLSRLDNYIKSVKGIKYYGRYMDDMFVFSNSKQELYQTLSDIQTQLENVKLEVNEKKTHIIKLSHGFIFMQIKYSLNGHKIIKRPTRCKIIRERRRLKKYKRQYDTGLMKEFDIYNSYKSWRNNVLKDCNCCSKSIEEMDKLYNRLFPKHDIYMKYKREDIIRQTYKELSEDNMLDILNLEF